MSLRARLRQAAKRALAFAAESISWWLAELRGMVPDTAARLTGSRRGDDLLLHCDGKAESFWRRKPGAEEYRAAPPPDNGGGETGGIVLCLAPPMVFETRLTLPLDAERNLRSILRHQAERLVPLDGADIEIAWRILSRDLPAKTLELALTVIRRATLAQAIAAARRCGLHPEKIAVGLPRGPALRPVEVPLPLPATPTRRRTYLQRGLDAAILAAVLCLYGLHLARLDDARDRLSVAVDTAQREAASTRQQFDEAADLARTRDFLAARRAVSPLQILDALTTQLPDGNWIFSLDLDGATLAMQGYAGNAAALIGLFESHPLFADPKFRSPITGGGNGTAERFNLSVSLRTRGDGS